MQHKIDWWPIDTAPTDGTHFDAWNIDGYVMQSVNSFKKIMSYIYGTGEINHSKIKVSG